MKEKDVLLESISKSFLTKKDNQIFKKEDYTKRSSWLFDFRVTLGQAKYLDAYTEAFYEKYKDQYPFQVAGLETAAILLVGAIVQKMHQKGLDVNGFYIRKSRKKYGLLNNIEGVVNEHKIILIDDIINSGASILKSNESLKEINRKVDEAFSLLSFKDGEYYDKFEDEYKIKVNSIFSLDEVKENLGLENFITPQDSYQSKINPFENKWMLQNPNPNYFYVVPKSFPAIYNNNIFYGRDDGNFLCVDKEGDIVWSYKIPFGSKGKITFSSPIIYKDKVFFGAYDGNLYALNIYTGKKEWVNFDADWVGASPAISIKNNIVYIGAEYGFWKKKGGVVAISVDNGKTVWAFREMPEYTHGSTICVDEIDTVFCGSNDGCVYALNSKNGKLKWKTGVAGAVKHRPAFDLKSKYLITADHGGDVTAINMKGEKVWTYKMLFGSYCEPKIYKGKVYVTSFDKHIYCFDIKSGEVVWKHQTAGRIFSSVEIVNDQVIFGNNEGKVFVFDAENGELKGVQVLAERVTCKVAFDKDLNTLYVLDYVQNLYSYEYKKL